MPTKMTTKKSEPRERSLNIIPVAYNSVSELIRATMDPEIADEFDARQGARELVRSLALLRMGQGITQAELAIKMECGQTKVSKMERSQDANLNLGDVVAFARALGKAVKLVIGDGEGLVVEVEGRPEAPNRKRVQKKE
jgi:Helix-turn-helix domain